jgi:hypothetical protein
LLVHHRLVPIKGAGVASFGLPGSAEQRDAAAFPAENRFGRIGNLAVKRIFHWVAYMSRWFMFFRGKKRAARFMQIPDQHLQSLGLGEKRPRRIEDGQLAPRHFRQQMSPFRIAVLILFLRQNLERMQTVPKLDGTKLPVNWVTVVQPLYPNRAPGERDKAAGKPRTVEQVAGGAGIFFI